MEITNTNKENIPQNPIKRALMSQSPIALNDIIDIQDLIYASKQIEDRIEFLKVLKKKRVSVIQDEIQKLQFKQQKIRSCISQTLLQKQKKSVSFPGVGKVSSKTIKGTMSFSQPQILIQKIQKQLSPSIVQQVIKVQKSINKKAFADVVSKSELSDQIKSHIITGSDRITLSIGYDEKINQIKDLSVLPDQDSGSDKDFDTL